MSDDTLTDVVRNIDTRLARVEQFLPTLATREELQISIAPLVTNEKFEARIAPLVTREELHEAIDAAVAPLVTRDEFETRVALLATREEMYAAIKAEGERARHHATMLFESLKDDNRLILEHLLALSARVDILASR